MEHFVPQSLPESFPSKRMALRISSGWHQVQRVFTDDAKVDDVPYRLLPYDTLEKLPHPDGRTESMFNPNGIAKNSGRIEPFLLFPMGVLDVGSMRQRGRHPISMVGRTHFDDPRLFEDHFILK